MQAPSRARSTPPVPPPTSIRKLPATTCSGSRGARARSGALPRWPRGRRACSAGSRCGSRRATLQAPASTSTARPATGATTPCSSSTWRWLRGLGSAAHAQLLAPDAAVVAGVSRQLERLIAADGLYCACVRNDDGAEPAGPLVDAPRRLPGQGRGRHRHGRAGTAGSVRERGRRRATRRSPRARLDAGARIAKRIRCCTRSKASWTCPDIPASTKRSPSSRRSSTGCSRTPRPTASCPKRRRRSARPARVDVIAQTLRVGLCCARTAPLQPADRGRSRGSRTCSRASSPTGAVAFAMPPAGRAANVWAAMFADQALAFAAPPREPDAWWRGEPLLV